ncbi:MAG: response regulator transcription factor [Candidatus Methanomethylophilus sp.]|nr:response regulator transcription factor [Methanomethylophilus sp.]MDD4804690.1 response regulator transcription factor [Candidatus Paceibacterota bacterium]
MIKIAFAEDNKGVRDRIERLILSHKEFELVGVVTNGEDMIKIAEKERPDVVLMDIYMPITDGLESTERIKKKLPAIAVIMLTVSDDTFTIIESLKAGANGYLLKTSSDDEIIQNIKYVYNGGFVLPPEISKKVIGEFPRILHILSNEYGSNLQAIKNLSDRELEVLKLVAGGLNNKEISESLYISIGTVKNYITNLLRKLELRDRVQLVLYAVRVGIKI